MATRPRRIPKRFVGTPIKPNKPPVASTTRLPRRKSSADGERDDALDKKANGREEEAARLMEAA